MSTLSGKNISSTLFSERLRKLIKRSGLSQRKFAIMIDYDPAVVSRWLKGEHLPQVDTLKKIAERTNTNFLWLSTGEGSIDVISTNIDTSNIEADSQTSDLPRSIMQTVAALEELLGDQSPEVRSDPVLRRLSQELAGHLLEKIQLLRSSGGPGSEQT